MEINLKRTDRVIWIITIVVFFAVGLLHRIPKPELIPGWVRSLPLVHAMLNGTCFLILVYSIIAIKRKQVQLHQRLQTFALILSSFFLISYLIYHSLAGDTKYLGAYKEVYYFILFSHIVFAGISFPLILRAYIRGLGGHREAHRKAVRFAYPMWLYVALTGVLVYVFLSPYYA